ncbi:PfkB family carbohydrate kinase [Dubosiella newyorkensis]|uniref:Carbohydrate kinase PfkB domain-containing protein n=1 Tax=Dubosiella newyorkensis TaxID=1862672 RepID=A0A1U7NK60_9FIRM|nr:PfkB family carbohydrate kinase [Dubosiella newyorkensis]OLU44386.1 hypothetical protein BO225_10910 [Dubosiella newyorkensis]
MKKRINVLGSMTTDVILYVEALPARESDQNLRKQEIKIGGCAFHVANSLGSGLLYVPCGQGIYADFVRKHLDLVKSSYRIKDVAEENGVCYCIVERDGERSFLAYHGAEYKYTSDMLAEMPTCDVLYFDGITMEEAQNECIVTYLQEHPEITPFFACSSRVEYVACLEKILALSPILHMNLNEFYLLGNRIQLFDVMDDFEESLSQLYALTNNLIIITAGKEGAYGYDGVLHFMPAKKAEVYNTIGAGDTHAGMCLYGLQNDFSIEQMLKAANEKAARKVSGLLD